MKVLKKWNKHRKSTAEAASVPREMFGTAIEEAREELAWLQIETKGAAEAAPVQIEMYGTVVAVEGKEFARLENENSELVLLVNIQWLMEFIRTIKNRHR
jgi:hypothetical protein